MIDLSTVRAILDEVTDLVEDLDGQELDETDAIASQSRGAARRAKAQRSQDLQFLATRLELAANLIRVEYWKARGFSDPLRSDRTD